ncbi:MAG: hypothetical protein ACI9NY_001665 [Kiritimatiellia bacterium]
MESINGVIYREVKQLYDIDYALSHELFMHDASDHCLLTSSLKYPPAVQQLQSRLRTTKTGQ